MEVKLIAVWAGESGLRLVARSGEFLDDHRLLISAPVAYSCDKSNRDKPTDTKITVVDLQGHEVAAIRRADVVELVASPAGYVAFCTGDHVGLLSRELQPARSFRGWKAEWMLLRSWLFAFAHGDVDSGPGESQYRLYRSSSGEPTAEITIAKGEEISTVADDGFVVCDAEKKH